jgi:serine/threonine protein phosphatase 1
VEDGPRRIIIGDVHGHMAGLQQLIALLNLNQLDRVYLLGDLIDRGPESSAVIDFVRDQGYFCLLGNHEQLMLQAFPDGQPHSTSFLSWLYCGGQETLDSYPNLDTLQVDLDWLQTLPNYLDLGDLWLVHAGLHPNLALEEQSAEEFCWIRGPFHRMPRPYFNDKIIVTGHTITFTLPGVEPGQLARGQGWLDIDTGAYHPRSGWLTALDWTQQQVYQVNVFDQQARVRPLQEATTQVEYAELA